VADIDGTSARDTINGTAGPDTLSGLDGSDSVFGGTGNDRIYGHSTGDLEAGSALIDAVRVGSGFSSPVFGVSAPGAANHLFVVEQHTGRIQDLNLDTGAVSTFLDLPDSSLAGGGEQGLLGLAFHPGYAANGRYFVYLTNSGGDIEVREYNVRDAGLPTNATAKTVLTFDHPFDNHNGGWMGFGPDGMLYIASGDGGGGGDPQNNAQNLNSLLGKILRIDVNGDAFPSDDGKNYAIPANNPFAGGIAGADEIWLYGLRNPWRASFDSATGDLWIGDVGQGAREEVDRVAAGQGGLNLGWKIKEGFTTFSGGSQAGLTDPILDYDRTTPLYSGVAVTGGYVYHGPGGAQGLYVFGDFASGNLWTVAYGDGRAQDFLNRNAQLNVSGGGDIDQISSFAVDGTGRLYLIGLDGDIHRLTPRATAGDASDYLRGEEGDDVIYGGFAFDDLHGNQGNDTVSGGLGGDWVVGGKDNDSLSGDEGDDVVFGNLGADTGDGGIGADVVRGGQGDDVLRGGDGADFISGDLGADTVTGGAGADIFNSFGDAGVDRITDFNPGEGDRVRLDAGNTYAVAQQGADTVVTVGGGATVILVGVQMSTLTGDWIFVG